jgi:hypothetical protein
MKLNLPSGTTFCTDASGKRVCTGSQMGRRNELPDDRNAVCKLRLSRLPFVDGDYDRWGAYWGCPANVWCAWTDGVLVFARADGRELAKSEILSVLPGAKFYR